MFFGSNECQNGKRYKILLGNHLGLNLKMFFCAYNDVICAVSSDNFNSLQWFPFLETKALSFY